MTNLLKSIRVEYGVDTFKEVSSVLRVVKNKIIARNLFGWREFLEDVLIDLVQYMIRTDFQYSGGAYVACGMQAAIDACRYCNAQKRRGDYETISLHLVEAFVETKQDTTYANQVHDLVVDIEYLFGKDVATHIKEYLTGKRNKISKEVLAKCRTPEFKEWLRNR